MSKGASAIGDLAGIIGGPVATPSVVTPPSPPQTRRKAVPVKQASVTRADDSAQPKLLEDPDERSDRITAILPISLLSQV